MTSLNQGLSSLATGGGKMRDPGNEVGPAGVTLKHATILRNFLQVPLLEKILSLKSRRRPNFLCCVEPLETERDFLTILGLSSRS